MVKLLWLDSCVLVKKNGGAPPAPGRVLLTVMTCITESPSARKDVASPTRPVLPPGN